MLTVAQLVTRQVLVVRPSCTAAVRALMSTGETRTLTQIRTQLGDQWPRYVISSVLSKLADAGEINVLPPEGKGSGKGKRYVATGKLSPHLRCKPSAGAGNGAAALAQALRRASGTAGRAGHWDGLVPAHSAYAVEGAA